MAKHRPTRIHRHVYEAELERLQVELARMQTWVRDEGARVVVLFEGRDAAGKGGTIKRITEPLNPRFCRVAALPAPTERETTQWYFQRYVAHLPAAGEIVLFDRSWYNRAGVEHVLGFCTRRAVPPVHAPVPAVRADADRRRHPASPSTGSRSPTTSSARRFQDRIDDPTKRWKLSPMDLKSRSHYVDYSRAKDEMFEQTDLPGTRVVRGRSRRQAPRPAQLHRPPAVARSRRRIARRRRPPKLPPRQPDSGYVRPPRSSQRYVPDHAAELELEHGHDG